ncbi:hypothetical protein PR202_gb03489 [Eleusine coracana subsp. coracana]|uniref:Uncharacterized protein n=1 Tax=Eleusine coracana subsp. coracana TaxID=191504 RepID=A0AAV5E1X2_ELECO|nr:hypothetical protein PR202_gb03489 [Eleusine coracana subsp. coracana]
MQTAAAFRPCLARPLRPLLPARPLGVSSSSLSPSAAAAVSVRCGTRGLGLLPASPDREKRQVACAAAAGGAAKAKEEGGGFMQTLQLGVGFALWYLFNIYFNIYNKQVRVHALFR